MIEEKDGLTPINRVQGAAAHGSANAGFPFKMGLKVTSGSPPSGNNGEVIDAYGDDDGRLGTFLGEKNSTRNVKVITTGDGESSTNSALVTYGIPGLNAPDGAMDRATSAMDSGPGFGALNVAPIGGDITLRASAVAGEASGASTAVDNLGWVKKLLAVLDVTAVPDGGAPTLDLQIQTQMPNGDWQDFISFAQVAGATDKQIAAWDPEAMGIGTQQDGVALTIDPFFANEDGTLAASTVRYLPLGDSMRVKWTFVAGGSAGDYTFSLTMTPHS